jgi:hypothetical protein
MPSIGLDLGSLWDNLLGVNVVYSNLRVILTHMLFNHYASLRSFIQGDHNTYFIAIERFRKLYPGSKHAPP